MQVKSILIASFCYIAICCVSPHAYGRQEKLSSLERMQNFHISQAEEKISKQQFVHAWGDLAYILCCMPNNHLAFKYMSLIAPKLNREQELIQYFKISLDKHPQDQIIHQLYQDFLLALADKKAL